MSTARAAKKLKNIESEDELPMPATPKRKLPFTPRGTPKNTPRHKARLIKEGLITPVVPARSKAIVKADTPLAKAKNNLHVSYVPKVLPCRENEFTDILNFIEGRLYDGQGGYVTVEVHDDESQWMQFFQHKNFIVVDACTSQEYQELERLPP